MDTLADYFDSFSLYLKTGSDTHIRKFLEGNRNTQFMSIYRNGFLKSCLSALKANFPSVVNLLGENYFTQIAKKYIVDFPPRQATLVGYGDTFVTFLAKMEPDLPYLKDFALLDLTWLASLNSEESKVWDLLKVNDMISQEVDLSLVPVSLVSSAYLIEVDYDLLDMWLLLKKEKRLNEAIRLSQEKQHIMLWRCSGEIRARVLKKLDLVLLEHLEEGANLEEVTLQALQIEKNFDISDYFSELLQNRLLTLVS
ncbi:DNA-binding domain-containing protein [Marinomonas sp. 15G1-11]|uniref:DNA-binding domain-containing protein n=1 Tax=Marinomonas phaeophyticola TaxID=3004091 RepID=A0ABT4JWV4_9GAMM|nr:DNA-binding domain-containing protein [Marinomonas sp. 15G1-11]MCZ2722730.1 DNA-binding domain-containing protein [Marinomonas sp. 15G1-11]